MWLCYVLRSNVCFSERVICYDWQTIEFAYTNELTLLETRWQWLVSLRCNVCRGVDASRNWLLLSNRRFTRILEDRSTKAHSVHGTISFNALSRYTDGSKTNEGTEAGVVEPSTIYYEWEFLPASFKLTFTLLNGVLKYNISNLWQ